MPTDTDKEVAAALRVLAARDEAENRTHLAAERRREADVLDPPEALWADGQWVADADGKLYRWFDMDGCWGLGGDWCSLVDVADVKDPQPIRFLAADQVAMPRGMFTGDCAKFARTQARIDTSVAARALWSKIAAALQADEEDKA